MPCDTEERLLTIAELAVKHGVTLRAIRFYEERGLLSPIRQGLLRLYNTKEEIKLQVIQKGKRFGFSLAEIKRILFDDTSRPAKTDVVPSDQAANLVEWLTAEQIGDLLRILERRRYNINEALTELYKVKNRF